MKPSVWFHFNKSYSARGWEQRMTLSPVGIKCATLEMGKESAPFGAQRRATYHVTFRKADTKTGLAQIKDVLTHCRDALKINEYKLGN